MAIFSALEFAAAGDDRIARGTGAGGLAVFWMETRDSGAAVCSVSFGLLDGYHDYSFARYSSPGLRMFWNSVLAPAQLDDGGRRCWLRHLVARPLHSGAEGPDTRFIVTNLKVRNARVLYEDVYCRRGQAENRIKSWKTHLAADRTSCTKATANQLRLFLHAGAYWLMWGLRVSMPRRSMWRVAQFDTLRLRLINVAARVVEMKTMIRIHLPTSCPAQDILRLMLGRIPRLVT